MVLILYVLGIVLSVLYSFCYDVHVIYMFAFFSLSEMQKNPRTDDLRLVLIATVLSDMYIVSLAYYCIYVYYCR